MSLFMHEKTLFTWFRADFTFDLPDAISSPLELQFEIRKMFRKAEREKKMILKSLQRLDWVKIGRASCRERVCQYV